MNLLSKKDSEHLEDKHIPDALAIASFWNPQKGQAIMDLGTGGGLPGLVLALEEPDLSFSLVDARQKKIQAVLEMADELQLSNVQGLVGRFEDLGRDPIHRERYDIVLARAVAALPTLLEYVAPFLKAGGLFYAWKGPQWEEELKNSSFALKQLKMSFQGEKPYQLESGEERVILCLKKEAPLDSKYPRRTGIPLKRPLHA